MTDFAENNEEFRNSELTDEEIILSGLNGDDDFPNEFDDDEDDELSGEVGRFRRPFRRTRSRSRRRSYRSIGRRESGASRFRRQALERVSKMGRTVQKALVTGKAQISDMVYYSCAEVSGKHCELISEAVSKKLGLTNIDNGKLGKDKEFVLSAVKIAYDRNTIDGKYADPIPSEAYNGEWELELNGKKVFDDMPVSVFADGTIGYNVNKPYGFYALNNPKHIKPQTTIEFNIKTPQDISGYFKVFLIGTTVKPN